MFPHKICHYKYYSINNANYLNTKNLSIVITTIERLLEALNCIGYKT